MKAVGIDLEWDGLVYNGCGHWILTAGPSSVPAISIAGDALMPGRTALRIAKLVLQDPSTYLAMCIEHFERFVDPNRFNAGPTWNPTFFNFPDDVSRVLIGFELTGDGGGVWTATLTPQPNDPSGYMVLGFSREWI
jgi:hypothetical protein